MRRQSGLFLGQVHHGTHIMYYTSIWMDYVTDIWYIYFRSFLTRICWSCTSNSPEIISSKWYTLSSCSHVAVAPEGTVRISITETERSARQIADDFVKLVHSDSSISTYRMCAHEPLQTTEDYTFSYSSNNSSSMLRHKRQQILFK